MDNLRFVLALGLVRRFFIIVLRYIACLAIVPRSRLLEGFWFYVARMRVYPPLVSVGKTALLN